MTRPYSSSTLSQTSPRADLATAPAEIVAPRRGPARCTSDTWDESSERAHPFFNFKWRQSGRVVLKVYLSMLVKRETKGTPSNVSYLFYFIFFWGGGLKKDTPQLIFPALVATLPPFCGLQGSRCIQVKKKRHSGKAWKEPSLKGFLLGAPGRYIAWELHCLDSGYALPMWAGVGTCIYARIHANEYTYVCTYVRMCIWQWPLPPFNYMETKGNRIWPVSSYTSCYLLLRAKINKKPFQPLYLSTSLA